MIFQEILRSRYRGLGSTFAMIAPLVAGPHPEVRVEILLLGPLVLRTGSTELSLPPPQGQRILALLASHANQVVEFGAIGDVLWEDGRWPRGNFRNNIDVAMSNLRKALRGVSGDVVDGFLRSERGLGFRLHCPPATVDLLQFQEKDNEANIALSGGRLGEAAEALRSALALWRGRAFLRLSGRFAEDQSFYWEQAMLAALTKRLDIDLVLENYINLVPELTRLTREHPLHEDFRHHLILALYGMGRGHDALRCCQDTIRSFREEDVEPTPRLSKIEEAILENRSIKELIAEFTARTVGRASRRERGLQPNPPAPRPALLPANVSSFTGREAELTNLDSLLLAGETRTSSRPPTVVITAVSGMAGVGKTALVVWFAHRSREAFPDGQLYIDLHGFDPNEPMLAEDALALFLRALGLSDPEIPAGVDERAVRYRALLDQRRMLVVLDNAAAPEQVRPLLPGSASCSVVVTSRDSLAGLVARDGAHPINLDVLPADDAVALLRALIGARVPADPAAATALARRCGRLPLALRIAAQRATARPDISLAALVQELNDEQRRLEHLDAGGDPRCAVEVVFSWSYRHLPYDAAAAFRLLSLHPGPDLGVNAAAALLDRDLKQTEHLLTTLTRAHMVRPVTSNRFDFHDLLRAYATKLANTQEADAQRRRAILRILDHYLHTAYAGARVMMPHRETLALTPREPGATPHNLTTQEDTLAWFTTEHAALLALIRLATRENFDSHAWQLAEASSDYLDRQGFWHDWIAAQRYALESAQRLGDPSAQARVHRDLGLALTRLDQLNDAHAHLQRAADLFVECHEPAGRAKAHVHLSYVLESQGRYSEALDLALEALALFTDAGHEDGRATALDTAAHFQLLLGDHSQALALGARALEAFQKLEDRYGEASAWDNIGNAHHHLGEYEEAVGCYDRALRLCRDAADLYGESLILTHLGETRCSMGDRDGARNSWEEAFTILNGLAHSDADPVRAKLLSLDHGT